MATKISLLKERLRISNKKILDKDIVQKMIDKFVPGYKVSDLCNRKLIMPIKKWEDYLNLFYSGFIDPYIIWAIYFGNKPYVFGWLQLNNVYHFTTQVAERYTIYNTIKSGKKIIWNAKFIFKQVKPSFFYGIKKKKINWYTINIMSSERALIQMIREWSSLEFVKSLPDNINKDKIVELAQKHTNKKILEKINALIYD